MKKIFKLKYIILMIILIITITIFCIYYFLNNNNEVVLADGLINNKDKEEIKKEEKEEIKEEIVEYYFVDIKGAVNQPNVYKLPKGSRVIDVINLSGGLRDDADTSTINLSKKIKDEMFIIIYSKDEIKKYKEKTISTSKINKELEKNIIVIDENNDAKLSDNDNVIANNKEDKQENKKEEKININTASKEELLTITGIGESKAISIIKYREENGNFNSIEDIKNVSGIGNSLFEKIKNFITV